MTVIKLLFAFTPHFYREFQEFRSDLFQRHSPISRYKEPALYGKILRETKAKDYKKPVDFISNLNWFKEKLCRIQLERERANKIGGNLFNRPSSGEHNT
jgi:hypothetical protein